MSIYKLLKLAERLEKLADSSNTPVDQLSIPEIATYMRSAGMTCDGPIEGDQIGFTFNNKKYGMQIVTSSFIRFAPLVNSSGQIWQVPAPQQIVKRDAYLGRDMPIILKMIANTIR